MFVIAYGMFFILFALITAPWVNENAVIGNSALGMLIAVGLVGIRSLSDRKAANIAHAFYVAPLIPLFFKTSEYLSYPLHGKDYDHIFIMLDRLIFGTDPTVWLFHHLPVLPGFIEYLQICYSLFYLLPVILGVELYRRRVRQDPQHYFHDEALDDLERLRFVSIYGFCLSYVGYIIFPAVGPRFFLHDFWSISTELPGLFITDIARTLTNSGENIHPWMTHAQAYAAVTRDAFPSGHTMMTLTTMILAFKFNARSRFVLLIMGSSLIFATVYLRYHYVTDVIGGALFALFALYTFEPLSNFFARIREKLEE
jgi:membrane-associated phospholipid phosphatase